METFYSVSLNGKQVGKTEVCRHGLYYQFSCRCQINSDNIYRLMVCCEGKEENLGVLIPTDGSFLINTKVPVKRLGEGEFSFYLKSKQAENPTAIFIPISPEEPFSYIAKLKDSFLEQKNDQLGIHINEP